MKLNWIKHASFQIITDDDKIIYIDPYQVKSDEIKGDIILVSHSHQDHQDNNSIENLSKEDTKIICPKTCMDGLKKFNPIGLDPNESTEIDGIKIVAIPAYTLDKPNHPKGNKWIGFVVEIGGKRIYHAGDTGAIPEMKKLANIDVALIPVGGKFTMGFKDAIEVCKMINPKIFIPMHHWGADLNQLKNMINEVIPSIKVEILKDKDLEI